MPGNDEVVVKWRRSASVAQTCTPTTVTIVVVHHHLILGHEAAGRVLTGRCPANA